MPDEAKTSVLETAEMRTHYYQPGRPILAFMFGLYCDVAWSDEAFKKWDESNYEYEGYLDPYPNIPHGARQLITVEVPKFVKPPERANPTVGLAEAMWPYLKAELTFEGRLQPVGRKDQAQSPFFDPNRPVLSTLALIYLKGTMPDSAQLLAALGADKYAKTVVPSQVVSALVSIFEVRAQPAKATEQLEGVKAALVIEFTTPRTAW